MKYTLFISLVLFFSTSCTNLKKHPEIILKNQVLNPVDSQLFGQFLEKCSWDGEIGGDLVINPETGTYDTTVLKMLRCMNIPNIRFPGGSDVDYFSWTDMIDHAPGQTQRKPYRAYRQGDGSRIVSDNRMGFNEFLNLCEELKSDPILVLNIGDAFHRKQTIREAQESAAGLLTYCNFEAVDMGPDWPGYRKKNGREKPWEVKYFEIGNEYWGFQGFNWKQPPFDTASINHLFRCIEAVADTLLALDPEIKIIVDGPLPSLNALFEKHMRNKIDYIAFHPYLPWGVSEILNDKGQEVDYDSLSDRDIWNAWVSTPVIDSTTGFAMMFNDHWTTAARSTIFDVACTEWNWNGWFEGNAGNAGLPQSDLAKGIGAAGFLHSFMREGDKIRMASQSMLAGLNWGITGIRVDPEYDQEPVYLPSLQVTGLYSNYHGNELLDFEARNFPVYKQALKMNGVGPFPRVSELDVVITRSGRRLFVHIINRSYDRDHKIKMETAPFDFEKNYMRHSLTGDKSAEISNKNLSQAANIGMKDFRLKGKKAILEIPAASVSVFVFCLRE